MRVSWLFTAEPTHTVSHQNSCLTLLVLFWKLYICVFEKKYVLIFLAFFLHLLPHMLKLAADYFNSSRRHWLFTTLVMCAATAAVLGNVDPLIQYMDCIDILCNTIKKMKSLWLCDSVHSLTKTQSFVFCCNKQTAVELQKYGIKGQIRLRYYPN